MALLTVLISLAYADGSPRTAPAPIRTAAYRVTGGPTALVVEATLGVTRPARKALSVPLFSVGYPLMGELPDSDLARIFVRDGVYHLELKPVGGWFFPRPKPGEITFSFRVAVKADRESRQCALPILPADRILVDLPADLYALATTPAAPVEQAGDRLRVYVPAASTLLLRWRAAPPPETLTPVFRVEADTAVSVAAASLTARSDVAVQVLQGEVRRLRLTLPEGDQLRAIAGDAIARWQVAPTALQPAVGRSSVDVELKEPARAKVGLSLTTERVETKGAELAWQPVTVDGAQHQGGRAYFRAAPGLLLRAVGRSGFERVSDGYAPDEAAGRQTLVLVYPRLPASVRLAVEPLRARVTADVALLTQLERGVVTQRARIDYSVLDVGIRQLQVRIGEGADVLEVDLARVASGPPAAEALAAAATPGLMDHELRDGVLTVRLQEAVKDKVELRLVVQRLLQRIDGVLIPRLEALGVERQTCLVGVAAGESVELRHQRATEAEQVDVRLLPDWIRAFKPKLAYRLYDRPNSEVTVETAPVSPEVDVVAQELCELRSEGWMRQVSWQGQIGRGEVFALEAVVPEGVTPLDLSVLAADHDRDGKLVWEPVLADWELDQGQHVLKVRLTRAVKTRFKLEARFSQPVASDWPQSAPGGTIALRAIVLAGARRLTGGLTIGAASPTSFRVVRAASLEAVGSLRTARAAEGLGSFRAELAFAIQDARWELDLAATPISPVVEVQSFAVLTARPGQVAVDATLLYSIQKAPVSTLTLHLPQGAANSSIEGDDIKSSQLDGQVWTVDLARKLQGSYRLRVRYDHVIPAEGGTCACASIGTPGAARHEGILAVALDSSRPSGVGRTSLVGRIEVAVAQPQGLLEIDAADASRRHPLPNHTLIAAYSFTGSGSLELQISVLGQASVLQAKALGAILETIIKEDGQTVTELTYDIRNASRQFLKVDLPEGAALLGAYVDGQPVSAATAPDGGVLVPLLAGKRSQRGGDEADVTDPTGSEASEVLEVSIVYTQATSPLGGGRTVALASPPVDVRTEALSWAVYLPRGYRAQSTEGNMDLLVRPRGDGTLDIALGMFADEARLLGPVFRAVGAAWRWASRRLLTIATWVALLCLATVVILIAVRNAGRWREWRRERARGRQPRRRLSPARLAASIIVLLVLAAVIAGMFLPSLSRAREEARSIRARNNLNQIAKGMATYLNEHGDNRFYPGSIAMLYKSGVIPEPDLFRDPETGRPFVYLYEGKYLRDDYPPNEPMGYMEGASGVNVLFFDSHVESYPYGSPALARLLPGRHLTAASGEYAGRLEGKSAPSPSAIHRLGAEADSRLDAGITDEADFEEDLAQGGKLDYGQKKLLDRIKSRRTQALAQDMPIERDDFGREGERPRPPRVVAKSEEGPTRPAGTPPGPDETHKTPKPGTGATAVRFRNQLVAFPDLHRYEPVRGGRQKGALPILFELPSDGTLPYIFHRPVTGSTQGEIELDCRPVGSNRPAKGVILLGGLGLVALIALGVAKGRKARRPSPAEPAAGTRADPAPAEEPLSKEEEP